MEYHFLANSAYTFNWQLPCDYERVMGGGRTGLAMMSGQLLMGKDKLLLRAILAILKRPNHAAYPVTPFRPRLDVLAP
jgi:hypothetical protein